MTTMFHYPQYRSTDLELIRSFVRQFPLALITSLRDGQWQTSHIPLFFDEHENVLFGHVDADNSHFHAPPVFSVQLVFAGPNLFIPPEAYATRQLPTWNYLAVHASGTLTVIDDAVRNVDILRKSAVLLANTPSAFRVQDSDPRVAKWIGAIRGLRIDIDDIEGRFKLSQDKATPDVEAATAYFVDVARAQITPELLRQFSIQPEPVERAA